MREFNPAALTPKRVAELASLAFPDRVGSGIWIDMRTGRADEGITFDIFRKDRISAEALLGHASFGAALGFDVFRKGNIVVTALAGAAHPYTADLTQGWHPIVGGSIRF